MYSFVPDTGPLRRPANSREGAMTDKHKCAFFTGMLIVCIIGLVLCLFLLNQKLDKQRVGPSFDKSPYKQKVTSGIGDEGVRRVWEQND